MSQPASILVGCGSAALQCYLPTSSRAAKIFGKAKKPQRPSAAEPQPNCRVNRFNAEAAEGFKKGRRGNVFSADLRAHHGVLGVKEIFTERDEVGR